jgi:hypothetical protein
MDRPITHLVINSIWIDENELSVGATDSERWRWDIEDGESGADAWTFVFVTLTKTSITDVGRQCYSQSAGFHCQPGDVVTPFAMAHVGDLFDIAWAIANEQLDLSTARERYFGKILKKAESDE